MPPSRDELFKRLLNRDNNDKKIANERMKQFKEDVLHWIDYDLVVINDNLNKCYKDILNFINLKKNNKNEKNFNSEEIKKHVENLLK